MLIEGRTGHAEGHSVSARRPDVKDAHPPSPAGGVRLVGTGNEVLAACHLECPITRQVDLDAPLRATLVEAVLEALASAQQVIDVDGAVSVEVEPLVVVQVD